MIKRLSIGLIILLLSVISVKSVFAGGGGRLVAPEPISCLLFAVGGATFYGIKRWRDKRGKSKELDKNLE